MVEPRAMEGRRPRRRARAVAGALTLAALALSVSSAPVGAARASGSVDVLFAGSLLNLMNQSIAPAFHRATGYALNGLSGGSSTLAHEISGRTVVADVFISASPAVTDSLVGPAHGGWITSYDEFATSPLVLGYNRASRFAGALTRTPWYRVVDRPGFLLGRTDPASDPKGVLAVSALREAARDHAAPALARLAATTSDVFPETTLVGRLQSGQLDAGFFYRVEAVGAQIPTLALSGTSLGATFTVALVARAPHARGARAFLHFLLGPAGRSLLERHGVTPISPVRVVRAP